MKSKRKRSIYQEFLQAYGPMTCLNLINIAQRERFFSGLVFCRSIFSIEKMEELIHEGLKKVKEFNLSDLISRKLRNGDPAIFRSLDDAIENLGRILTLDLINQILLQKYKKDEKLFKLSEEAELELERNQQAWNEKCYINLRDGRRGRGLGKKTILRLQEEAEKLKSMEEFYLERTSGVEKLERTPGVEKLERTPEEIETEVKFSNWITKGKRKE